MDKKIVDKLLSHLSEIYNKSLTIYELVTTKNYDRDRALLNISELYTNHSKNEIFIQIHPELLIKEVEDFLRDFEDFYFELKQVFVNEDQNTARLYSNLTELKEAFESLTTAFSTL